MHPHSPGIRPAHVPPQSAGPAGRLSDVRSWGARDLPVPYAVPWTAETVSARSLTVRSSGTGLAYRDEVPRDRDRHGVLWARMRTAPGQGRPNYRALHSARQRHAMLRMLCQVCGERADRTSRGWLFLLPRPEPTEDTANWPEGTLSTKPPVCRPCAVLALRHCPHLADPHPVRSRKPRVWGVFGGFVAPDTQGRLSPSPTDDYLSYGHPYAGWFLASQLVVELTRCVRVPAPRS